MRRRWQARGNRRAPRVVVVLALTLALYAAGQVVSTPAAFASTHATDIAVGQNHACAIVGGKAFCWGDNSAGELGNNNQGVSSSTAVAVVTTGVLAGKTLASITAGDAFTCALDTNGAAYCWGQDGNGQLGNNSTTPSAVPVAVSGGHVFTQISASDLGNHTCAIDTAGKAWCWGLNTNGQLGNNSTTQSLVPVAVDTTGVLAGKTLTRITVGTSSTCALDNTGKAYCWGLNTNGELGNNSTTQSLVPVAVSTTGVLAGKTLTEIYMGATFACALDSTGAAYCWGQNSTGQLGNNSTTDSPVPVAVTTSGALAGKTLTEITAGNGFTCALDTTGKAYCWGDGSQGQLGDNSFSQSPVPVAVTATGVLAGVSLTQIDSGTNSTCAMDASSNVYCWGQNGNGQLGNGTTGGPSTVPVKVIGLPAVTPPGPPTAVTAAPGDAKATISWTAPSSFGSGTLTGYTATATVGGQSFTCSTTGATTCVITGLTNNTTYTVTVVTHTTAADSVPSSPAVSVTPQGVLTITVSGTATLPTVAPGNTTSGQLGTVTVSDDRGVGSWTATVSSTSFQSGPNTIALSQISYWSGPATATSGTGTFTPGQPTAANAQTLTVNRTAFSLTGGSAVNSASWNPTLVVAVPLSTVAGTYTATITHSVA